MRSFLYGRMFVFMNGTSLIAYRCVRGSWWDTDGTTSCTVSNRDFSGTGRMECYMASGCVIEQKGFLNKG